MATNRDFVYGPNGELLPSDHVVAQMRREEIAATAPKTEAKPAAKKETFREAFARNRAAGKDTFTWNGKKYTTEMAKPTPRAPAAKAAPVDTRRPGPTRERAADMPPMARSDASTSRGVRSDATPRPDASTSRGVRAAAPAPAQKPKTGLQAQRERDEQRREERREFGRQRAEDRAAANRASAERLRSDPRQQELRAAREARESMSPAERSMARGRRLKEMFQRSPSEERESKRPVRGMAKGGSVSKRADGIAKRGKTHCKII